MKKIITICFLAISINGIAQFATDYVKAADAYFKKGDYYSAAQYYEKYLGIGNKKNTSNAGFNPYSIQGKMGKGGGATIMSTKEQAVYNIAECYRMLNYPVKAAPAYAEVLANSKDKFPLVQYAYGATLRALQKYEEAKAQLSGFLASYATADATKKAAETELKSIDFIQKQLAKTDLNLYKVNKIAGNETGANYAPAFWNGEVLFTSTRKEGVDPKTPNNNLLYKASFTNDALGTAAKVAMPQPEGLQQGAAAVTADGNTIYFTQWEKKTDKKHASIYSSTNKDGNWTTPTLVGGLNVADYSTQQPFIQGSTIYFASNRPGGVGGMDIYKGTITESGVGAIENLGFNINTEYDEEAPSYWANQNILVFSSNGRVGMGGFDLFYSTNKSGGFAAPQNFGHPVNSIKDDIYFTTTSKGKNILENVLISSDRSADCCLELFAVSKTMLPKNITGSVVSCESKEPIANATVKVVDANNNVVTTLTTDYKGAYNFQLDEFAPLKATATFEGLVDGNLTIAVPNDAEVAALTNPTICLEKVFPPPPGQPIVLENVYFDYEKWDLLSQSNATLDYLVEKLKENPNVKIEIGGHTDSNGEDDYNVKLSQKRAQACVNYLISKGIDKARLSAKGYGESQPIADNTNTDGSDNPEGRAKNRRTEFKVVQ